MKACKRCGIRPRAIDEGDGRELINCEECIRETAWQILPVVEVAW